MINIISNKISDRKVYVSKKRLMNQNLDLLRYRVGHGLLMFLEDLPLNPKTLPHVYMISYF